jgi:hypothetical protein
MAKTKVPVADGYHGKSVGMMKKAGVPTTQDVDLIAKTEVPGAAGYYRKSVHVLAKAEVYGTA